MKVNRIYCVIALMFSLFLIAGKGEASEFSTSLNQPQEQIDKTVGYLDVLVEKDREITYEIHIKNSENYDIEIESSIENANSFKNGLVDYAPIKGSQQAEKAPFSLKNVIESDIENNIIKLKANEEKIVKYSIKTPIDFKGLVVGGIKFKEKSSDGKTGVVNVLQRTVAIFLHGNEIEDRKNLKLLDTKLVIDNNESGLTVVLENNNGLFIKNASIYYELKTVDGKIISSGNEELKQGEYTMAPYSKSFFNIPLNLTKTKKIRDGKYFINYIVSTDKNKWNFKSEIEINEKVADKINEDRLEHHIFSISKKNIIAVIVLLLLLLIIGLFIKKANRVR